MVKIPEGSVVRGWLVDHKENLQMNLFRVQGAKKKTGVTGVISLHFCRPPQGETCVLLCSLWPALGLPRPLPLMVSASYLSTSVFLPTRVVLCCSHFHCTNTLHQNQSSFKSSDRMRLAHHQIKMLLDVLDKNLYPSD